MHFVKFTSNFQSLPIDKYGIRQENAENQRIDNFDLVIVPGRAFTKSKCRYGVFFEIFAIFSSFSSFLKLKNITITSTLVYRTVRLSQSNSLFRPKTTYDCVVKDIIKG